EKVLDNVEEEIMLLGKDFRILWANKKVFDRYGKDKENVISDHCYKVTHNIDHICQPPYDICPVEETIKTGKAATVLHTHFDKEGNKVYAEVSGYPVYEKGKVTEFIHISKDVTERVMADEQLREQQKAILELSTPVVKIWEGIITLPLIGIIDSARAQQIMEGLLSAVVETQASIAIIDITGVPFVDTEVSDRLIKTMKAADLLGTKCILVGIKPEIAQTLVHLGIDLENFETFANLQAGLEQAFKEIGKKVIDNE
ncbi:MAG: STAS domain-containing protein, partial [Desulfobulbaceae bacterium]|nr:STAS domain-containing protein [Desulfobulbaceae bacterium]